MSRNVQLLPGRALTGWRKISLGSWRPTGDSSIHADLELNLERFYAVRPAGISLNHFLAKALGVAVADNPAFNAVVRWGRVYERADVDIFFHVLADRQGGEDLSGLKLERVAGKSLSAIAEEFAVKRAQVQSTGDAAFVRVKAVYRWLPGWLCRMALDLSGWLLYTLNVAIPSLAPRDAFSGIMVSNVGSFGIDRAFVPFAPYSRVSLVVAMGEARARPIVDGDRVTIARTLRLGFTCDHRLVDGFHIGQLFARLRRCFDEPAPLFERKERHDDQ